MPTLDVRSPVLRDGGTEELAAAASCGCETALSATDDDDDDDPYAPAESLRLRIGEDIDWSDVVVGAVAAVLERDDSTKGAAANPKCAARRSAAAARSSLSAPAPAPRAAVAVVIGGKAAARDYGRRRRSPCQLQLQLGGGRARVFASSGAEAAAGHHQPEPGSPKVSCLGGVRSHSQPRTAAGEGITSTSGRRWWAWLLVADVMFSCCWNGGRRDRRPAQGERSRVE